MEADLKQIRRENLRFIIDEYFDGKDSKFAEILGKQPNQLSRIFSKDPKVQRNIGSHFAREIEGKAGLPKNWLDLPHSAASKKASISEPQFRKVPVIDIKQFKNQENIHYQSQSSEVAYCVADCSQDSFAIKLNSDSMGDAFPINSKVIFDPTLTPRHRSFVFVQVKKDELPIFRQLLIDGSYRYLKALNGDYPVIQLGQEAKILGVFIGIDFSEVTL